MHNAGAHVQADIIAVAHFVQDCCDVLDAPVNWRMIRKLSHHLISPMRLEQI